MFFIRHILNNMQYFSFDSKLKHLLRHWRIDDSTFFRPIEPFQLFFINFVINILVVMFSHSAPFALPPKMYNDDGDDDYDDDDGSWFIKLIFSQIPCFFLIFFALTHPSITYLFSTYRKNEFSNTLNERTDEK